MPDARPKRHLMRFLSRARRWIVWTVCGLAVLVSLFVLALPWSTRYLVDRIAVLLSDRYDIDFSAGRVEFALRSLSFTLHDVRLATGAVPESATVVAKRVNLDLATAALRGALAFDRIEIVDPSVSWIAGSRMPASRVPHTTRTDSRPVIIVGRLDVVNLDATVSTASSLRLTVQGLSASLRGDVQGRLAGEIHADRGIRLEADSVAGVLDRVTADVTIGSETLVIRSLVAESNSGDLRLDGALMFGESGGYDLKYRSTIDLSELRKWWDRSPPARGRVELSGSIAGVLTDPRLTFDLRAREFAVGALSDGRLDATGHASVDSIVIDTCVLRSVDGVFNGRGRIALRDGDGRSLLAGEWSLPRLRALASRLNLDPSRLPALPVSGTANLSWPGPRPAIGTLAGDLHVNLRRPGGGSLTVAGEAGRWRLQYRHALAGETLAELRLTTVLHGAELRRSRLYGVVDVSSQDVAALLRQLRESVIPVPAVVDVVRSGHVTARGTVAGSIGEPVVDLLVSASDVSAGDVDAIQVAGAVHADRRQIVLKPLAVDTAAAHLEMRGSIGFARMESTGEFDVRIDGPGRLAPIVPADWRPTGSIAAKGSWSGRLDRPRVSARLTGEELIANGLHFESLAGDVEVVDDELLVHDLRLSQRDGQLRVDGRYNIRERALSTTVEGRGLRVTLRRLWSPASDDPSVADADLESVSVDMRLEGSVLRPSGEVSLTADSVRLSGRDAGAVVARAHAAQGQVRLDLGAPRFGAEATGSVTLESPRPWTADVTLNGADVVQALTLLGVNPETVAGSTAALSASGRASGNLDTRSLSNVTMEVRALDGQVRGQPLSLVQPARLSLDGSRLALEPVQLRLGGLSVRAAGSWGATRDTPAEGIAVNLDGRVEDVLEYLPPASRDRLSVEGPLRVDLSIRGGADLASISGDAFAQLTYLEEKAPERAGSRPRARADSLWRSTPGAEPARDRIRTQRGRRNDRRDNAGHLGRAVSDCAAGANQAAPRERPDTHRTVRLEIAFGRAGRLRNDRTRPAEPQRHACQRRDVPRARGRLSASGRRRPRGIRHPDCRTDRQPAVRGDDRAHGRKPHPAGGTSLTRGMDRSAGGHRRDRRSRSASRPGQWWRRLAQRDGHPTRNRAGITADHHREERVSRDPPRAEKRAQCRSDLAQSERASSTVGHGHHHGRPVHGTRDRHGPHRVGVDTSVERQAPSAAAVAGRHDARRHAPVQRSADAREQRRQRRYGSGSAPDRHDVGRRTGRLDRHRGRRPHSSQWEVVSTEGERHRVYARAGSGAATERLW